MRRYKERPRPAGVYRVVHRPSQRMLLGASPDAPAMLNRIQAQLSMDSHPNPLLQSDWDADGESEFVFEVVDLLPPPADLGEDVSDDLETMLGLWQERLRTEEASFY